MSSFNIAKVFEESSSEIIHRSDSMKKSQVNEMIVKLAGKPVKVLLDPSLKYSVFESPTFDEKLGRFGNYCLAISKADERPELTMCRLRRSFGGQRLLVVGQDLAHVFLA